MTSEDFLTKEELYESLFECVMRGCNLSMDSWKGVIFTDKNEVLEWDECECFSFPTPIDNVDGILLFGDGTLEFHDKDTQDAYNWADYENDFIENVLKYLYAILA